MLLELQLHIIPLRVFFVPQGPHGTRSTSVGEQSGKRRRSGYYVKAVRLDFLIICDPRIHTLSCHSEVSERPVMSIFKSRMSFPRELSCVDALVTTTE